MKYEPEESSRYWLEICTITTEDKAEILTAVWQDFAEQGNVVIERLGDPADLDPNALLPEVYVKIYLSSEQDTPAVRQAIAEAIAPYDCVPTFHKMVEQDWANAWKDHYHPFPLGQRFWIQPSWLPLVEPAPAEFVLTLDPGMAFGTGLHPTTQLCLELVEEYTRPGLSVLDLGTGSGILAIAAAKLGAGPILAVDNDPLAVEATLANAALNGVAEQIELIEGTLAEVQNTQWDVVVANILAVVIVQLVAQENLLSYTRPGGKFIFSGIVDVQSEDFVAAVSAAGGRVLEKRQSGDWVAFVVEKIA